MNTNPANKTPDVRYVESEEDKQQAPVNHRIISIDCNAKRHNNDDIYMAGLGYRTPLIDRTKVVIEFTVVLSENGTRIITRIFQAEFRLDYLNDEKRMVDIILGQLKHPIETQIWAGDSKPKTSAGEWVTEIVLSERAKEMFEFIMKYKPKLLEAFGL